MRKGSVAFQLEPGEQVTVGDGPMSGAQGRLARFDEESDTAQVYIWIERSGDRRQALVVVTLSLLRPAGPVRFAAEPPRPKRGRPRRITDEQLDAMRAMYASGSYSHLDIARALSVSKSSVTNYLRQLTDGERRV